MLHQLIALNPTVVQAVKKAKIRHRNKKEPIVVAGDVHMHTHYIDTRQEKLDSLLISHHKY